MLLLLLLAILGRQVLLLLLVQGGDNTLLLLFDRVRVRTDGTDHVDGTESTAADGRLDDHLHVLGHHLGGSVVAAAAAAGSSVATAGNIVLAGRRLQRAIVFALGQNVLAGTGRAADGRGLVDNFLRSDGLGHVKLGRRGGRSAGHYLLSLDFLFFLTSL